MRCAGLCYKLSKSDVFHSSLYTHPYTNRLAIGRLSISFGSSASKNNNRKVGKHSPKKKRTQMRIISTQNDDTTKTKYQNDFRAEAKQVLVRLMHSIQTFYYLFLSAKSNKIKIKMLIRLKFSIYVVAHKNACGGMQIKYLFHFVNFRVKHLCSMTTGAILAMEFRIFDTRQQWHRI